MGDGTGAVMLDGKMEDDASLKQCLVMVELAERLAEVKAQVEALSRKLGRKMRLLVGKPGLDGHSNGAEQIAARARDCGMDIHYEGIRLTPAEIVTAAVDQKAHVVGLSILSGSHLELVPEVVRRLREAGVDAPVVVGGIIPEEDQPKLREAGVAAFAHVFNQARHPFPSGEVRELWREALSRWRDSPPGT